MTNRNVDELINHGINVGYFVNPKTGYIHLYTAKKDTREETIELYNSNLNDSHYDIKTLIRIKNN